MDGKIKRMAGPVLAFGLLFAVSGCHYHFSYHHGYYGHGYSHGYGHRHGPGHGKGHYKHRRHY